MSESEYINFHELLANRKMIAAIWCIDDVRFIRPDLSDEQAWEVLEQVGQKHDCDLGISWTTIECWAEELFPPKSDRV